MVTAKRGPLADGMAEILDAIAALDEPDLTDLTPNQARALRDGRPAVAGADVHAVEDLEAGVLGPVPVRVLRAGPGPAPVVVWLHGGGWVMGSWATHNTVLRSVVARTRCHVVAPDYRLAPEHHFPAGLDDCRAALDSVLTYGADFDLETDRCVLAGDSAGGNLAAAAALDLAPGSIVGLALAYPVTDCHFTSASYAERQTGSYLTPAWMRWFREHYLTSPDQADDWRASPLRATDSQLTALPPTYTVVASHDPLRDEGLAFAERITAAGGQSHAVIAHGLTHGFLGWESSIPAAADAFDQFAGFIRSVVEHPDV